jgi:phosphoglycolate phosphatase
MTIATGTLLATTNVQALTVTSSRPSSKTTSRSPFAAYIFDVDGTLSDSFQLGYDATNKVLERNGIPTITPEIYHDHTRYSTPDRLARHAGLLPGDKEYAERGQSLGKEFDDLYIGLVNVETSGFFRGIPTLLDELPTDIPLAALTNAAVRYADAVLKVNSHAIHKSDALYRRFKSIRGADNVPTPKPSPDGLLTVCRDLQVAPSSCVYVGDSPTDAQAAHSAGMAAVGVLWGSHSKSSLEAAPFDILCESVDDLKQVLLHGLLSKQSK